MKENKVSILNNTNIIYLHPSNETSLREAYQTAFESADEIFILSAYLTDWQHFNISKNCKNATLIVGKDFGITRKSALIDALNWKKSYGSCCNFFVANEIDGFHPKIAIWKHGDKRFLIVGSSNLTVAAFESNYEANVQIKINASQYEEIEKWIANILGFSKPVHQKWIDTYQEAKKNISSKKKIQTSKIPPKSEHLILPTFPGLAAALAERKHRSSAFDDIRKEFKKQVSLCATKKISQNDFYNWLLKNWNGAEWKFQGSGIFRQKETATNWQMLCDALLSCIEAPINTRDDVVRTKYDDLEQSGKVRVRKAFLTEMLCHFFPQKYPLWNSPVEIWLRKIKATEARPSDLTIGGKYIWLAEQLRLAIKVNPEYPAKNLAELDHVIWAYCRFKKWLK